MIPHAAQSGAVTAVCHPLVAARMSGCAASGDSSVMWMPTAVHNPANVSRLAHSDRDVFFVRGLALPVRCHIASHSAPFPRSARPSAPTRPTLRHHEPSRTRHHRRRSNRETTTFGARAIGDSDCKSDATLAARRQSLHRAALSCMTRFTAFLPFLSLEQFTFVMQSSRA